MSHSDLESPEPPRLSADRLRGLPPPAQRYLGHAIAVGTPLANRVHVSMTGQLRLGTWLPFRAVEDYRAGRGFCWKARLRRGLLPVSGFDRYLDGTGEMRWKLLGCLPVATGKGPDVARSAAGRFAAEAWLLPSAMLDPAVRWTALDARRVQVTFEVHGRTFAPTLWIADSGRLDAIAMPRWGDPDGEGFREAVFGGVFTAERAFGGYTIPTECQAGWGFDGRDFTDGPSFRAVITSARFDAATPG